MKQQQTTMKQQRNNNVNDDGDVMTNKMDLFDVSLLAPGWDPLRRGTGCDHSTIRLLRRTWSVRAHSTNEHFTVAG